jgi:hypothetical protein
LFVHHPDILYDFILAFNIDVMSSSIPNIFLWIKDSGSFPQKKMSSWNKRVEKLCEKRFTFSSHELLSFFISL